MDRVIHRSEGKEPQTSRRQPFKDVEQTEKSSLLELLREQTVFRDKIFCKTLILYLGGDHKNILGRSNKTLVKL